MSLQVFFHNVITVDDLRLAIKSNRNFSYLCRMFPHADKIDVDIDIANLLEYFSRYYSMSPCIRGTVSAPLSTWRTTFSLEFSKGGIRKKMNAWGNIKSSCHTYPTYIWNCNGFLSAREKLFKFFSAWGDRKSCWVLNC